MLREPVTKRAVAFIDASNTRASARRAFGDGFGNYNPVALAEEVCAAQGWTLAGVSYYLGVPDIRVTEDGHYAWMKRCARWRKQGVHVFTRTLLQDDQGTAREKGIDMRLALDAVAQFRQGTYDVAVIFSQDQDFSELAAELKAVAREQKRWVQVVSSFPAGGGSAAEPLSISGGISGTLALPLNENEFRKILDTPENRKRVHTPLPPQVYRGAPAASEPDGDAKPLQTRAAPVGAPAVKPRRAAVPARWAATVCSLYLLAAAGTFGYLSWINRTALSEPARGLPILADQAANALVWPVYWTIGDGVKSLKPRLTQLQSVLG